MSLRAKRGNLAAELFLRDCFGLKPRNDSSLVGRLFMSIYLNLAVTRLEA